MKTIKHNATALEQEQERKNKNNKNKNNKEGRASTSSTTTCLTTFFGQGVYRLYLKQFALKDGKNLP